MNQTERQPQKPTTNIYTMGFTPMVVGGEVGCLTLIIVILALIVGLWLDRTFGYPARIHDHSTFRVGSVLVIPDVLGRYTLDQTDDSFPNPRNSAGAPGERGGKQ